MARSWELVDGHSLFNSVSAVLQHLKVTSKAGHLTGYVNHPVHAIINYFSESLGMYSVSGWIEDNKVRLLFYIIQNLQHITGYEFAIVKSVQFAFSFAASTASSTISTPITLPDTGAII